jgi:hypothetical protein
MQVEISFTVPLKRNVVKFNVTDTLEQNNEHKLSAMLDTLRDTVEIYLNEQAKTPDNSRLLSSESFPDIKPDVIISERQAQVLRWILRKREIPENAVCSKYGVKRLEDMTWKKAVDIILKIMLTEHKRTQKRTSNK